MQGSELGHAVAGGALIGLGATVYWRANRRVAGVSGIVRGALLSGGDRSPSVAFLAGLVVVGVVAALVTGPSTTASGATPVLAVAGLLVGLGTRVGGGCTSGHGVCGLSRLSRRSLVATILFIASGALTVLIVSRLMPGLRLP